MNSLERQRYYRNSILKKYGAFCQKCKFNDIRALQIDHVKGGGRKELGNGNGGGIAYLIRVLNNNDGKYQILCANCNAIKRTENKEALGRQQHKIFVQ